MNIWSLINELKQTCSENEKQICQQLGLNLGEYQCLSVIFAEEKLSCHSFTSKLHLSHSRCSRILSALVKKGYLERTENENDRRYIQITLTKQGQKLKKQINQSKERCIQKIENYFSPDKAKELKKTLQELILSLKKVSNQNA